MSDNEALRDLEAFLASVPERDIDRFLAASKEKATNGTPASVSIRQLLRYIGAERRGTRVVNDIQRALDRHELVTEPSFTSGWIDNRVEIRSAVPSHSVSEPEAVVPEAHGTASAGEVSLTVGSLESSAAGVVAIERTSDLPTARALVLRHDYSQLAVMSGERRLMGAVSWESMAMAALRRPDYTLHDATVQAARVEAADDLIALIPTIAEKGFVFVVGHDQKLAGIVTTADLSIQFATLAKPFFLLGEIERRLRDILSTRFEPTELAGVKDPSDQQREIASAHDLTIGETVRFVENPANWSRLEWAVDRSEFIKAFHEVREIRTMSSISVRTPCPSSKAPHSITS